MGRLRDWRYLSAVLDLRLRLEMQVALLGRLALGAYAMLVSAACVTQPAVDEDPAPLMICQGDCVVDAVDQDADLARIQSCTSIVGNLSIDGSTLSDLSALANLRSVSEQLTVARNP